MIRKANVWTKPKKMSWDTVNVTKLAEIPLVFVLGMFLSTGEIFGRCMPFGVAWVAATNSGLLGFSSLLGSVFGYLFLGANGIGIHYAGASVLTYAVGFAFREFQITKHKLFMPISAAVFSAIGNVVYLSQNVFYEANVIFHTTEIVIIAVTAYLLAPLFTKEGVLYDAKQSSMASLILGATILLALVRVEFWVDVSLGRSLAIFCLLLYAGRGGAVGLLAGCLIGIMMDITSGRGPYYTMVFSICAGVSGLFSRYSRIVFTVSYVVLNAVVILWTWESGMRVGLLYETFIASILYYMLPKAWEEKLYSLFKFEKTNQVKWDVAKERVLKHVKQTSQAFGDLYDTLKQTLSKERDNTENPMEIFVRMEERIARRFPDTKQFFQDELEDNRRVYNDALKGMMERGRAVPDDFSVRFRSRCMHFSELIAITNEELLAFLQRRQYQSKLKENRMTLCKQYAQFDQILMQTATELGAEFTPDYRRQNRLQEFLQEKNIKGKASVYYDEVGHLQVEMPKHHTLHMEREVQKLEENLKLQLKEPIETNKSLLFSQEERFSVTAGIYAKSKDGNDVNGDAGTWFRRDDGLVCIVLCDGMGSGKNARAESALAAGLLEKFLKAGMAPKWALSTVNSALVIKSEQTGACTTVDLLTVDLYTGICHIYKFGASPTYIRKGGAVSVVKGSVIPAGLISAEEVEAEASQVKLQHGDWLVIASDGIEGDNSHNIIHDLLSKQQGTSPGELAKHVLEETRKEVGAMDDATVIAVRLKEKGK